MSHINYIDSYDEFKKLLANTRDMQFNNGRDDNHAWKLHIFLDQDNKTVTSPVIQNTVKFLIENNVSFKMGNGGDDGKVFTVYIGEMDQALQIGYLLNENFGVDYKKEYPVGVNLPEDMRIFDNIGMRFEGCIDDWSSANKDSVFAYYGYQGIPTFRRGQMIIDGKDDKELQALACHIFLAEKCGYKYLGKIISKNIGTGQYLKH